MKLNGPKTNKGRLMAATYLLAGAALGWAVVRLTIRGPEATPEQAAAGDEQPLREQTATITNLIRFSWRSLPGKDHHEYVRNLRGIGCPEETITVIVRGHLRREIEPQRIKNRLYMGMGEFVRKEQQLDAEVEGLLAQDIQTAGGVEKTSVLFTRDEEQKIAELRKKYPQDAKRRLAEAAQFLGPQALLDYRLDREGYAGQLQAWLGAFRPTREQFYTIAQALEGLPLNAGMTSEAEAALDAALGNDTVAQIALLQGQQFRRACGITRALQLPQETTDALLELMTSLSPDNETYDARLTEILKTPLAVGMFKDQVLRYQRGRGEGVKALAPTPEPPTASSPVRHF
jgi:hypothetical protein